jgi:hypothetical protein
MNTDKQRKQQVSVIDLATTTERVTRGGSKQASGKAHHGFIFCAAFNTMSATLSAVSCARVQVPERTASRMLGK